MILGSVRFRAFIEPPCPVSCPALASSWLLILRCRWTHLGESSFVSGPGASTLHMVIFSKVNLGVSPVSTHRKSLVSVGRRLCFYWQAISMRRAERRASCNASNGGPEPRRLRYAVPT